MGRVPVLLAGPSRSTHHLNAFGLVRGVALGIEAIEFTFILAEESTSATVYVSFSLFLSSATLHSCRTLLYF